MKLKSAIFQKDFVALWYQFVVRFTEWSCTPKVSCSEKISEVNLKRFPQNYDFSLTKVTGNHAAITTQPRIYLLFSLQSILGSGYGGYCFLTYDIGNS